MPKYKVTYWPGSADATPALFKEEIERLYPAKTYHVEAANFQEAQRITINGLAGATSDSCLIEEEKAQTP